MERQLDTARLDASTGHALEERIRSTIQRLRVLLRGASLNFALNVGRVVVESLYDGDLSAWRSRAKKDHALRTLALRPELPLSASALYRSLAIYELSCRNPNAEVWRHLGVSHLRAVIGLSREDQDRLLALAESQQWTVVRLERETLGLRDNTRASGGRRPLPQYVRSIRRIFELTSPEALEGLEQIRSLNAREAEELAEKLSSTRERLRRLEKILTSGAAASLRLRGATLGTPGAVCSLEN